MSNKNNACAAEFKQKVVDHKQRMVEQGGYFFISPEPDGFTINTDNKEAREEIFKLIFSYIVDKEIPAVSFESSPSETGQ